MNNRIFYTKPSITELEISYAMDAVTNGWGDKCYEYINLFEQAFCKHLGVKYAIATSSCTGALHMGLSALNIGPGDEVILADINWIASAAPIVHLGAKPVLVDVSPDSWCVDPSAVEASITTKTKAILAVHIYGNLCEMDTLLEIGKHYNIPVIEDAAEAIGSIYHGKYAGSMGAFGVFSFHGTKTITTGEGGMFVTNNKDIYDQVLTLSNHGRTPGETRQFWPNMVGFKYKMSNIQAAIGCAQIQRIDELIKGKRRIFKTYEKFLSSLPIKMNPELDGTVNGFWMPTIVVDSSVPFVRQDLLDHFRENNIDGRVFFWPLSMLPAFETNFQNKVSYSLFERAINLPSYQDLTDEEMEQVTDIVKKYLICQGKK